MVLAGADLLSCSLFLMFCSHDVNLASWAGWHRSMLPGKESSKEVPGGEFRELMRLKPVDPHNSVRQKKSACVLPKQIRHRQLC